MAWDERLERNPFYVLELLPGATALDAAQAGQRLLASLAVGLAAASTYPTPLGPRPRDEPTVRWAMGELADPERRALHALWAVLPADEIVVAEPAGWPDVFRAMGWRRW